jgi:hypothetical protein
MGLLDGPRWTDRELEILMPKAEWGVKRTCITCHARFYDLARDPIVCPKCGAELDITVLLKPKRAKPAAKAAAVKVVAKDIDLVDDDDDEIEIDDDDDTDAEVVVLADGDEVAVVAKGGKVTKGSKTDDDDDSDDDDDDLDDLDSDALLAVNDDDDDGLDDIDDVAPKKPKET